MYSCHQWRTAAPHSIGSYSRSTAVALACSPAARRADDEREAAAADIPGQGQSQRQVFRDAAPEAHELDCMGRIRGPSHSSTRDWLHTRISLTAEGLRSPLKDVPEAAQGGQQSGMGRASCRRRQRRPHVLAAAIGASGLSERIQAASLASFAQIQAQEPARRCHRYAAASA